MEHLPKKILIYSLDFYPDHSGISIYSTDFAKFCEENELEVTVITGFPFYPNWKKKESDKFKLFRTDFHNNIKIVRGYMYVPQKPSSLKRIIHELSFLIFAFFNSFFVKKPDYVVVFTTPVLLGALAVFMNKFWKAKIIINVQDFQIEAATSLGMLKDSKLLKILEKIEKWSYDNSTWVSSISQSMVGLILERKRVLNEKILFWPNWIEHKASNLSSQKGFFRNKFGISPDKKIIAYAGNIGKKQGLESLVDLAADFRKNNDVFFLIIGNGAGLQDLVNYATSMQLENLTFLPFLNPEEYQFFLQDIDLFYISQAKVPFDVYFPSKLLGIMSKGIPLVVHADIESELYKTLSLSQTAIVCNYGERKILAEKVENALQQPHSLEILSKNSKIYSNQFERDIVLNKILKLFK